MKVKTLSIIVVSILLIGAVLAGFSSAQTTDNPEVISSLQNVRDYSVASQGGGMNYAVDGGALFVGNQEGWRAVETPDNVIINAVAQSTDGETVYIGAAGELTLYRSNDGGQSWLTIPLSSENLGSVTDIAVDEANRLVYVGTDTDGLYRLRDVGSSLVASGHLILDEPVEEVVADSTGQGLAFVRTRWNLYRAEQMGLEWALVEGLPSPATALAIANTNPPTVYVGTANSGVRMSQDGINWQSANQGLSFAPGSQLFIDDLAVDPAQPEVLYVSSSAMFGSANAQMSPLGVAMSTDAGQAWAEIAPVRDVAVTELLPVAGETGSLYALTQNSRTPMALGDAPQMATVATAAAEEGMNFSALMAWILAGLAAIGFGLILIIDLRQRRRSTPAQLPAPQTVRSR